MSFISMHYPNLKLFDLKDPKVNIDFSELDPVSFPYLFGVTHD